MSQNGDWVTFRIELAENGFIGNVTFENGKSSNSFVATNLGFLWLAAKEKVKELLEIEDKEEE